MSNPSPLYPVALTNLADALVVVVGGGPIGQRKVKNVLICGAHVRLVSPEATASLQEWAQAGQIEWVQRAFRRGDLAGARLVFAATSRRAVNRRVAEEAAGLGLLCNVADAPAEGTFHVPAVHRQDGLVVAVSTEAGDPKRAVRVRNAIARQWATATGDEVEDP